MNLEQIRNETTGCRNVIHLNNAGASLMPRPVANAMRDYMTEEENYGGYELAEKRSADIEEFYQLAARFLNCKDSNIAFTNSATDSYNRVLSSIPFQEGDVILTTANDYPSNFIAFLSLQKRFGIKVVIADNAPAGEVDLDDLESKLKKFRPKLVSVSHVPTSSGLVQPAEQIGSIIKNYDSLYLLDACQSLGQLSFDVQKTHADFVSGTFRKFLRGPRGAGLLYVSDKALQMGLEPLLPDLRGAEWTDVSHYHTRPDARRFEDWETNYALMMGSKEAFAYALRVGMDTIEERNAALTAFLKKELAALPQIQLRDRGSRQCSIVTFTLNMPSPQAAREYFRSRGINIYTTSRSSAIIDYDEKKIDWTLRASPHYYNTEHEIDQFIQAIREIG